MTTSSTRTCRVRGVIKSITRLDRKGEGTIGKLAKDDTVYQKVDKLLRRMRGPLSTIFRETSADHLVRSSVFLGAFDRAAPNRLAVVGSLCNRQVGPGLRSRPVRGRLGIPEDGAERSPLPTDLKSEWGEKR